MRRTKEYKNFVGVRKNDWNKTYIEGRMRVSKWLFDYDSTIVDTLGGVLQKVNEHFGTQYTIQDAISWKTEDYMARVHADYMWSDACFFNEDVQYNLQPVAGAIEGIHKILEDHKGIIVSDRNPKLFDVTRAWLDAHGLDVVRLLFTRNIHSPRGGYEGMTKSQVAYLYKLDTVVEDAPHNAVSLSNREYINMIYLLDQPYNQDVESGKITRVNNWNDLRTLI